MTKAASNDRVSKLAGLLDDSLANYSTLSDQARQSVTAIVDGLMEMAKGIFVKEEVKVEKEVMSPEGMKKVIVSQFMTICQRQPDIKAAQIVLQLANYDPKPHVDNLLNVANAAKSLTMEQNASEYKRQASATADKIIRETQAMDKAFATEEQFERMAIAIVSGVLGEIQRIDPDHFNGGENRKQMVVESIGRKLDVVMNKVLRGDFDKEDDGDDE